VSDWRDEHERDSLNFEDEEQTLPRGEAEGVRVLEAAATLLRERSTRGNAEFN